MKRAFAFIVLSCLVGSPALGSALTDYPDTVDFELQNAAGQPVRLSEFAGSKLLVTFGFTHCEHICPMTVTTMARAIALSSDDVRGLFISVDTERDTPAIAAQYARKFSEAIVGLSGSHEQVAVAAKQFRVSFVVSKSETGYTVQHTQGIFLVDADGRVIDMFALNTPPEKIAAVLQ